MRSPARRLSFCPFALYTGASWKGRVEATNLPSVAKANLKKVT